jgi:isopentenyl diphosphate isomerase/L-lactate dehydrogenase-like FMN-dependent dehydrogenase
MAATDDQPQQFANAQYEIYLQGIAGKVPEFPITYRQMERKAKKLLSAGAYGYVAGGAGAEATMAANRRAFERWKIVPRMFRDIAVRDMRTELLGTSMAAPLMLAPIGVQSIIHPEGELATARAAAEVGVPHILSTASSHAMEEVGEAAGDGPRWYQLYWPNDPDLAASFLERAEKAGYTAVVVTLDTWLLAWRPRDLEQAYLPFLKGIGTANYFSDPVFRSGLEKPPEEDLQAAVGHWIGKYSDPTVTWERLSMLREATELPIVLKGIQHPDDARRAADEGVDGIIVSNHGGRQVDGAIGSLDALPGIVDAVPDEFPVLFDSGVRSGADAFKALALGARAALIGRPFVWGLAVGGQAGVKHVMRGLLAELDLTLALAGYTSFDDVRADALTRVNE